MTTDGKRKRRASRRDFGSIKTDGTPTDPRFSAMWWEGGKQHRKRGFRTRTETSAFLAKVRTSMGDGTLAAARRAEALFTDVGEEWLKLHSAALRSHHENEIRWRKRIKVAFDGLTLAAVTSARVLEFKADLISDDDLADGTRNQYLQQVRAVLRYAVGAGYLNASPTERIRNLMIRVHRGRIAPPIERRKTWVACLKAFGNSRLR